VTQRYSHVADAMIANGFRAMEADSEKATAKGKVVAIDGTR